MVLVIQILRMTSKSQMRERQQLTQMSQMRGHLVSTKRETLSKPNGWIMHSQPPVTFTVANLNALGMHAALKWKYKGPCGDLWGWKIGEFQKVTEKWKYKGCYEVQYDDQSVHHWPKDPDSEHGLTKKWVLLTSEPEEDED